MLMALVAMALLMVMPGCSQGYGGYYGNGGYSTYGGGGPEWDGVFVQGGYNERGYNHGGDYRGGYNRNNHAQAFHAEGGHAAAAVSDRGRASMGARAGGGAHASSSGGRGRK